MCFTDASVGARFPAIWKWKRNRHRDTFKEKLNHNPFLDLASLVVVIGNAIDTSFNRPKFKTSRVEVKKISWIINLNCCKALFLRKMSESGDRD